MAKILKYVTIASLALMIAVAGIDRLPQAMMIIGLLLGGVYFIRRKVDTDMRTIVTALFLTAFLIQVTMCLFSYNQTVDTKYYGFSYKGDDYVYGDFGDTVGKIWRLGIFPSSKQLMYYNLIGNNISVQKYQLYNAFVFYLFGSSGGQILLIINCFLHAVIIIPVYFICRDLDIRNKVMIFIFPLFLFWPSTFYWSLFNFKEPAMLFVIFAIFGLFVWTRKRPGFINIIFLLILSSILYSLKTYLAVIPIMMILYSFIFWKWRHKKSAILIFLLLLILTQLLSGRLSFLYERTQELPEKFFNIRHSVNDSSTKYFGDLLTFTYPRTILYLPFGISAVLLMPFLLKPFELFHIVANIESMLWWALLPFLINGLWIAAKAEFKKTFLLLSTFFYWVLLLALTQGNMGTLIRQKTVIYYIGFIFVGLAIDRTLKEIRITGDHKKGRSA